MTTTNKTADDLFIAGNRVRARKALSYNFSRGFERIAALSLNTRFGVKHYRIGDYIITYNINELNILIQRKDIYRNPFTGVIVAYVPYRENMHQQFTDAVLIVYPDGTKQFIKGDVLQEYLTKLIFVEP